MSDAHVPSHRRSQQCDGTASDAPRDARDRLGEFLYRVHAETGRSALGWSAWSDHSETVRERWREAAERDLPAIVTSCGLKIVPDDDGETK